MDSEGQIDTSIVFLVVVLLISVSVAGLLYSEVSSLVNEQSESMGDTYTTEITENPTFSLILPIFGLSPLGAA